MFGVTEDEAKQLFDRIVSHLESGGRVMLVTYAGGKLYSKPSQFRISGKSIYVARGKSWDCINGCAVRFGRYV